MGKFLVALFVLLCCEGNSQGLSFTNNTDKMMLKAIADPALYILRQDYYIVDTTEKTQRRLGLNKQPFFGRTYFVALLADGKFYTENTIDSPWAVDSNFKSISGEKRYIPVLGELAYRKIEETNFKPFDSLIVRGKKGHGVFNSISDYATLIAKDSIRGFEVAQSNEIYSDSTVWYWIACLSPSKPKHDSVSNDTPSIQFDAVKGKYSSLKKTYTSNNFFYDEKTIGGFIFITKASFGKIQFLLHGLILRNGPKFRFLPLDNKAMSAVEKTADKKASFSGLRIEEIPQETKKTNN